MATVGSMLKLLVIESLLILPASTSFSKHPLSHLGFTPSIRIVRSIPHSLRDTSASLRPVIRCSESSIKDGAAVAPAPVAPAPAPADPIASDSGHLAYLAMKQSMSRGKNPAIFLEGDVLESLWWHKALVGAVWAMSAWVLGDVLQYCDSLVKLAACVVVTVTSLAFTDFFSGIVHWSADNYGNVNTPVWGSICHAFQGHHTAPWTITYRQFANNVHKIAKPAIPLMVLLMVVHPHALWSLFWVVFLNTQIMGQQLHRWSHMPDCPAVVQVLQQKGLILSRKAHGHHHSGAFEGTYCIVTGWCNQFLDRIQFFRWLENRVYDFKGVEPNCWKLNPEMRPARLN